MKNKKTVYYVLILIIVLILPFKKRIDNYDLDNYVSSQMELIINLSYTTYTAGSYHYDANKCNILSLGMDGAPSLIKKITDKSHSNYDIYIYGREYKDKSYLRNGDLALFMLINLFEVRETDAWPHPDPNVIPKDGWDIDMSDQLHEFSDYIDVKNHRKGLRDAWMKFYSKEGDLRKSIFDNTYYSYWFCIPNHMHDMYDGVPFGRDTGGIYGNSNAYGHASGKRYDEP